MRYTILALVVAHAIGVTQARADMVTYTMTGTITSVDVDSGSNHPLLAVGDQISWTLQYDRSLARGISGNAAAPYYFNYHPLTNLITNIVDRTTGSSLPLPPVSAASGISSLRLYTQTPGFFSATDQSATHPSWGKMYASVSLSMYTKGALPSYDLSNLQLNKIPFALRSTSFGGNFSHLGYDYNTNIADSHPSGSYAFDATVTSITPADYGAPEPGSLTLFLLGASGLALRGMRRRFAQNG